MFLSVARRAAGVLEAQPALVSDVGCRRMYSASSCEWGARIAQLVKVAAHAIASVSVLATTCYCCPSRHANTGSMVLDVANTGNMFLNVLGSDC